MKIQPKSGKVLIRKSNFDLVSKGGIVYPRSSRTGSNRNIIGTIIETCKDSKFNIGTVVIFQTDAGLGLIGSDHFDIDEEGSPAVGFGKMSNEREYCVVDETEIVAEIEDYDPSRIF